MKLAFATLLLAIGAKAQGFDFRGCNAGSGQFDVSMEKSDKPFIFDGNIPSDKVGVKVWLIASSDLDVQLYDTESTAEFSEGKAIVGYCQAANCNTGLLNGDFPETKSYQGMEVTYSGFTSFTSDNREDVSISQTTRTMKMGVYAYSSGSATVYYTWDGDVSTCCAGTSLCYGTFSANIGFEQETEVGAIDTGVAELEVKLTADKDLDIRMYDTSDKSQFETGKCIVGYQTSGVNAGLLSGDSLASVSYRGNFYTYSGYNGVFPNFGNEFINIQGETKVPLMMKAYGYSAGTVKVDYSYSRAGSTAKTPIEGAACSSSETFYEQCVLNPECSWKGPGCTNYGAWLEEQCRAVNPNLYTVCLRSANQDYNKMVANVKAIDTRVPCLDMNKNNYRNVDSDFSDCVSCDATDSDANTVCMYKTVANPIARCAIQGGTSQLQCIAVLCTGSENLATASTTATQTACIARSTNLAQLCYFDAVNGPRFTANQVRDCVIDVTTGARGTGKDLSWIPTTSKCEYECICEKYPSFCCEQAVFDAKCTKDAASQCSQSACVSAIAPTPFVKVVSGSAWADLCDLMPTSQRATCLNCAVIKKECTECQSDNKVSSLTKCIEENLVVELCAYVSSAKYQGCLNCAAETFAETNFCVNKLIIADARLCANYCGALTSDMISCVTGGVADSSGSKVSKCADKNQKAGTCNSFATNTAKAILTTCGDQTDAAFFEALRLT